jgi:radical SAM superfamily enzyme
MSRRFFIYLFKPEFKTLEGVIVKTDMNNLYIKGIKKGAQLNSYILTFSQVIKAIPDRLLYSSDYFRLT